METLNHQEIEHRLFRETKKQEAVLNAEYVTVFDASMNGSNTDFAKERLNILRVKNAHDIALTRQKPIDTINLPVSYDYSTPESIHKGLLLNGAVSACNQEIFRAHLDKAEISLALVNGQLGKIVYAANNAAGFIWKNVVLRKVYPYDVEIKVVTDIELPPNRATVYKLEPGTLNLASVGLRGNIFNFINFRHDPGRTKSAGHWIPFLKSISSHGRITEDKYEKRITDTVSLIIPKGIKEFVVGSIGSVVGVSSFDPHYPSQGPQNYGYGFVDLRSKLDSNLQIMIDPLTNEYKAPPGGIQLSVRLEISQFHESS